MTLAVKHFDPIIGIDIHIILAPPAQAPTPMPNPYVGIVFDPFDYVPWIGATVRINGLRRAQAGTSGLQLMPHLPLGGPFGPPPPSKDSEIFMGSSTVAIDGDAQSYLGLPVLSCQSIGIPAPPRFKKLKAPKALVLPTSVVLAIPIGKPVIIGGTPTISLMAIAKRVALTGLGKGLRKLQRSETRIGRAMKSLSEKAKKKGDELADKFNLSDAARNRIHRAVCTVTGHPVDVATGKVFTDTVDFALPGPIPLRWERVWYSTSTYEGPLGHGWHGSYDAALYVTKDVVLYRAPDGRLIAFPPLPLGGEHFDRAEGLTLLRGPLGYAIRTKQQLLYRFRDLGREDGERPLSSISDPADHDIQLHYDDLGRLSRLIDSAGRVLEFKHDGDGRIVAVTAPHPDDAGERVTLVQYAYDHGNLVRVLDALKTPARYRYQGTLLSQETDRNGLSFHFEYDGAGAKARCVHTWGDGGIYDHRLTYDEVHGITTVVNSLGQKRQFQHQGGVVVRAVDPNGGIRLTEYDDDNLKIKETDPIGRATEWSHDARGNLLAVVAPDGARTEYQYDASDRRTGSLDAVGGRWSYRYDGRAQLVESIDPLGHATCFEYSGGQLITSRDRAGHAATFEYDAQRNLVALHGPGGAVNRWRHDALGRVTDVIDPIGNVQRRSYDLAGRLVRVEGPDGNVRHIARDGEGNAVHVKDDQRDVRLEYQGMSRLAARTEAGTTVRFEYDTEEQLIGIVNEQGHVYRFELDVNGEVLVEHGWNGIRRAFQRNLAGQVVALTRASGDVSRFRYDRAGRVTAVTHADKTQEGYAYRADGELVTAQNATTTVRIRRDQLGRVLREEQSGHWVESEYDARGLRIRMRSSLGADQRIERDAMGRVIGLRHSGSGAGDAFEARFSRDEFGQELERLLPGGVRSRWQRDRLGRPVEHELSVSGRVLRERGYQWGEGVLHSIIDAQRGAVRYGHDALGQLAWARHADGTAELRMPDAVGNLFRREDRKDRTYGPAGELLESIDDHGRSTAFAYDAEGNLIEKRRSTGETWRYRWGADGMLRAVERPDGTVVRFGYDALGRRVSKSYRGLTTRFVWDGDVPLHEWVEGQLEREVAAPAPPAWSADAAIKAREAALTAHLVRGPPERGTARDPITWLFEPESSTPLAKLSPGSQRTILTDHLGTPNLMLDERGAVTWSAEIGALGDLRDLEGARFDCPFRWPGQYEDAETGLHYNRHRYYDPESGAYISQDPIGLGGGLRLHAYVPDPTTWTDPNGLTAIPDFDSLVHMARNSLDFSTAPDSAVFWSTPNMRVAQEWAAANGRTTLEQTAGGRYLDDLNLFGPGSPLTPAQAAQVWDAASARFAAGASGEAHVFSTGSRRVGPHGLRTWWRVEQPGLRANPNVSGITRMRRDGKPVGSCR